LCAAQNQRIAQIFTCCILFQNTTHCVSDNTVVVRQYATAVFALYQLGSLFVRRNEAVEPAHQVAPLGAAGRNET
jgi:hypothetical protein